MDKESKQEIRERYVRRIKKYGDSIEALASGTESRRDIRYEILTSIGIQNGDSILDVGCGLAHYYQYLQSRGLKINYTGIDIVPELIASASKKYPNLDLSVRDLQEDGFEEKSFDFVVCSQVFNYRLPEGQNEVLAADMLGRMHDIARKGLAVDFLTSYVDYQESHLYYYSPENLFRQAKQLTRRVALRHDYPLFEFCLYLYPTFQSWSE